MERIPDLIHFANIVGGVENAQNRASYLMVIGTPHLWKIGCHIRIELWHMIHVHFSGGEPQRENTIFMWSKDSMMLSVDFLNVYIGPSILSVE